MGADEQILIGLGGTVFGIGFPLGSYLMIKALKIWINKPSDSSNGGYVTKKDCASNQQNVKELVDAKFDGIKTDLSGIHSRLSSQENMLQKMSDTQTKIFIAIKDGGK